MTYRKHTVIVILTFAALVLSACSAVTGSTGPSFASVPAGQAYADGNEIYFSHTEVSDAGVAEKLTNMMKSPVLTVPALAQSPDEMLAKVYVFENGVTGKGPLGFQADVFNAPPETEGYSPLRKITFVSWVDEKSAQLLKSEADILKAETDGLLTLTVSDVVVNMPFMVWNGGKR